MSKIRTSFLAFAVLAGTLGALAAPALAADWGRPVAPTHRWDGHDWRFHRPVVFAAPYAVPVPAYVPPPAAYAPPPVVYAPPAAALSVTIPFHL